MRSKTFGNILDRVTTIDQLISWTKQLINVFNKCGLIEVTCFYNMFIWKGIIESQVWYRLWHSATMQYRPHFASMEQV